MLITANFDSNEFDQPAGFGIDACSYPEEWQSTRLGPLCAILQAIRDEIGEPLSVVSGYRSVEYNQAMYNARGETPTDSQHSYGRAADIRASAMKADELHATILQMHEEGRIHLGGLGKYDRFVHVDIRTTPDGHLARWDYSTDSGDSGGQSDGQSEGAAEEDEDEYGWLVPALFVGAVLVLAFARRIFA